MGNQSFDEKAALSYGTTVLPAHTTDWRICLAPNTYSAFRVDRIFVASDDTIDHVVRLGFCGINDDPSNSLLIGRATVLAGAGNGTVALAELLALVLNGDLTGLAFAAGFALTLGCDVAMAAGKTLTSTAFGGEL